MIEQVKALLAARQVTRAVIVDDAFDDRPRGGDIEDPRWDRFFDDLQDADHERLAAAYGAEEYERQDPTTLRRDPLFIDAVWNERRHIGAAAVVFEEFERVQGVKRNELEPLRALLETSLGLTCQTFGRDEAAAISEADIIFLDLFLGFLESEEAITRAIARVKGVVDQRRQTPPSVVLLSASPRLLEVGPRLRDEAELLGCQFRMIRKVDLGDTEKMLERLYELVFAYPDSQRLNRFVLAWEAALKTARTRFLRSIRTLDLADYANLHSLALEAEDEPVGDYVLDLYDLHLHHSLEGDETLVRAAKGLNEIGWHDYPSAQFMPSAEVVEMMDGAVFQNETRTRVEAEVNDDPKEARLGDVFLAPATAPPNEGGLEAPVAPPPPRYAYVVLSQACDIQHADAEQLLLLRGTVRPYTAKQHENRRERTPVMRVGEVRFSIEWDVLAPETWRIDALPAKIADGYRRVRRFRTPFALQLQQDFIGRLGRVGTLTAVPAMYSAGVKVFLRTRGGNALLLTERAADAEDAVYLVGRTEKKDSLREWLRLSEPVQDELRRNLRAVAAGDLPVGGAAQLASVRDDPAFYRRLKAGIELKRGRTDGFKPFNQTPHDVVQIVTRSVCVAGAPAPANYNPVIIEVSLE